MTDEVSIVGGGLIGSSIAWRLAQRGLCVTVTDAGTLGGEASSAGAGMLTPGAEAERAGAWLDLGIESLRLYSSFVEELRAETGLAIDYRVSGCLVLDEGTDAAKNDDGRQTRAALHRTAGIRVEERPEGLFYPDDAQVDPVQLLRALRCAAEARGVRFETRRVDAIESGGHAAVVVAAGAWSGSLRVTHEGRAVLLPETLPVKGHLIGYRMPPGTVGSFLRRGAAYVLQRADGLLIAGSNEERVGFDTAVDPDVCAALEREAAKLVPALAGREPDRRWIGFRPALRSGEGPLLRRVEGTNVWLAYGHFRNGILLTPVSSARVSEEVASALRGS